MTDQEFERYMGVDGSLLDGTCIPTEAQWDSFPMPTPPELPPEPSEIVGQRAIAYAGIYL